MATTLKQLRRLVCDADFGEIIHGTATTGDTNFLTDTDLLKSSVLSEDRLPGSWLITTMGDGNAGKERRIASHLVASGRANLDNPLPEAIVAGDEYEIHDILPPSKWNLVINDGLARCTRKATISVPLVEDQTWYDLKAIEPTLELADDVMHVYKRRGTTANQWVRTELPGYAWMIEDDGDHIWLKLHHAINPDADNGLVLIVQAILPYPSLASDSDATTCPIQWARAAAVVSAYELYGRTIESGAKGAVNVNQEQAAATFTDLTVRYAPQFDRPIQEGWE